MPTTNAEAKLGTDCLNHVDSIGPPNAHSCRNHVGWTDQLQRQRLLSDGTSWFIAYRGSPKQCRGRRARRRVVPSQTADSVVSNNRLTVVTTHATVANLTHLSTSWGNLCAFYEGGASGTVKEALEHVHNLQQHGCITCGSDATNGFEVSGGRLTVNVVHDPKCLAPELCPSNPSQPLKSVIDPFTWAGPEPHMPDDQMN